MTLSWRSADASDLDLLAEWNHELIRNEGHRNRMNVAQLKERMRGWLAAEYRAVIFSRLSPCAYALYRPGPAEIYLRQFFVARDRRRAGVGQEAMRLIREEIWPPNIRLTVEVLCANEAAVRFWRKIGFRDYALSLEIMPPVCDEAGAPAVVHEPSRD